jgi:hypothetical protein
MFKRNATYVVKGSRCCNSHLDEKGFLSQDSIQYIKPIFGKVFFDEESIKHLIVNYQQSKIDNQFLSQFDNSRLVEDNVLKLIGFY